MPKRIVLNIGPISPSPLIAMGMSNALLLTVEEVSNDGFAWYDRWCYFVVGVAV